MYTINDIIEKLILIEQDSMKLYSNIADKSKSPNLMLSIMAKALAKEELRHIQYYESLKKEIRDEEDMQIDFFLYDRVAKLLNEFRHKIILLEPKHVQELIKYALEFEKKNIALLLDIQGRLVVDLQDVAKSTYEIISKLIEEEREHEKELQDYLVNRVRSGK
jgi:rubrerythrin